MIDASAAARAVFAFVADQALRERRVNVPIASICDAVEVDPVEVDAALEELGNARLLASWTPDGDPVATLTPLAASRLGLALRESTRGWTGLMWAQAGERSRRERYRPKRTATATDVGLELDGQVDERLLDPFDLVAASDEAEALGRKRGRRLSDAELDPDRLPRPTVLLTGCAPWPDGWRERCEVVPATVSRRTRHGRGPMLPVKPRPLDRPEGACPACKGAPIKSAAVYCSVCDRWGLDWLLRLILKEEAAALASSVAKDADEAPAATATA